MAISNDILIFAEKTDLRAELITLAHTLTAHTDGGAAAIVLGPKSEVDKAISAGADKVYYLKSPSDTVMVEDYVPTIASLLQKEKPLALLIGATKRGNAVAGRLGAILGTSAITNVKNFERQGQEIQVGHQIFGRKAIRIDTNVSGIMLATVKAGSFEASATASFRKCEVSELEFIEPEWKLLLLECKTKPPGAQNLTAAKKVVCVGCGLTQKGDLAMAKELARILTAEIGCTRKLSENYSLLPQERHIGISGAFIKPDLYIGIGVSGQMQHTAGITDSRVVAAINKDRNAPIFANVDYGIVGDLHEVMPELIKVLQARRKEEGKCPT
jgi:Electron transfer flavoprotein, alpha subunit